jgi:hypothetical protein
MPRVAALFELRDDVIGDGVTFGLGQALPQPAPLTALAWRNGYASIVQVWT